MTTKSITLFVKAVLPIAFLATSFVANAFDFESTDGIYYTITDSENLEVTVTYYDGKSTKPEQYKYSGDIVIPSSVTNDNKTYSVTAIRDSTFFECTGLTSLTIPESITKIGKYAFEGCEGLTSLTIPESITTIDEYTFYGFTGLTSITLPENLKSIGARAFYGCTELTSITIPENITTINEYTFLGCSKLTNITLPDNLITIGRSAFNKCTKLTNITIPESVTTIGDYAFGACSSLTNIIIPNSVTSIGDCAFYKCSSLTEITLPNHIEKIGSETFRYCSGLVSITIPESVTFIRNYAFNDCTALSKIYVNSTTPPTIETFYSFATSTYSSATLYVPFGGVDAYKSAEYWSNFTKIKEDPNYFSSFLAKAQNIVESNGEGVGYYTSESISNLSAVIEKYKDAEVSEDAINELQSAIDALEIILPELGKFYTITTSSALFVDGDGAVQSGQIGNSMCGVFQFESASDGTFYLYNVERGIYLNEQSAVAITSSGDAPHVNITYGESESLISECTIVEINDISAFSHTLTVDESGYGTLYLNYPAAIPSGVKAYVVSNIDGTTAKLTQLTGVIPAQTAVIVTATAGDYQFAYSTAEATAVKTNKLQGSLLNVTLNDSDFTYYSLSSVNDAVGFYTNESASILANEAYLAVESANGATSYTFAFENNGTTHVDTELKPDEAACTIYDLHGRKLTKPTPGINIIQSSNGSTRKIVVK